MSELPPPHAQFHAGHGTVGDSAGTGVPDLRSRLVRIALFPAVFMALLGGLAALVLALDRSLWTVVTVATSAVLGSAVILFVAFRQAEAAARAAHERTDDSLRYVQQGAETLRSWTARFHYELVADVARAR